MKVLYVEDNAQDADLTHRSLARSAPHLQLTTAGDLAGARSLLDAGELPDLLLLDMRLPDGNGLELLQHVRERNLPLTVVMLTGSGDEATVVAALRGGADDYIVKQGAYLDRLPLLLQIAWTRFRFASEQRARPIRVLYAERTATDVDLLARHLMRFAPHILVSAVSTGEQVIARLDAGGPEMPQVLLLDFQLPGMNALELVKLLRQERDLDLPILIITGHGDEDSAIQTLKLGATDYLVKQDDMLRRLPMAIESAHFRVQLERERGALRDSEARFHQMANAIGDTFWLADPQRHSVLYVSPGFERIWGEPPTVLQQNWMAWQRAVHPNDLGMVTKALAAAVDGHFSLECRIQRPDGQLRHIAMRGYPANDESGQPFRRAGVVQDITERKAQEARIQHLAYHDALTGLPNRSLLMDRLALTLAHAQRQRGQMALLFLDLDRFKTINDTLGHLVGDEMLKCVAERLRAVLRDDDTVARLGGDEFVIVLPDIEDVADPAHVAEKLMASLSRPFQIDGHELHVTCSLGVSLFPRDGEDAETLLKFADTALYKAKGAGRNDYRFFSPEMDARAHDKLRLENDLRRAIERHELLLHYQPQMDLLTGKVRGVEALVRWLHPRLGLIAPNDFIPLAEETGLILEIGDWVLNTACQQLRRWREQGQTDLVLAVNLSARQLQRPGLDLGVARTLAASGVPAHCLELEITESSVMQDPEQALALLRRLHQMGVLFAIDDFGTGYTNFAYLKQLPLQALKIDRSFIQGLSQAGGDDAAIAEAIIAMSRKMNLRVIAEGVETEEQRLRLQSLGCDGIQGYLLARPMPAEALMAWLAGHAAHHASASDMADTEPASL
ncbi:EAL domain-containing protein [Ideonella azotifigens]|uniref:EAL domain-containing protein n=1 Tax=Ideonella azotifigens TaxID=513160 RepID=A0ABN1K209_9BURK|nr:EAL domain-containing protein [Ideonella azotifigens]MCD2341729.1 EAL domain-containing protein [Ideonella azotifigens]